MMFCLPALAFFPDFAHRMDKKQVWPDSNKEPTVSTLRHESGIDATSPHDGGNALIANLKRIVGSKFVLVSPSDTRRDRKGFRFGDGDALAVVRPGTLVEQWQVLQACVASDVIVITQASNTG